MGELSVVTGGQVTSLELLDEINFFRNEDGGKKMPHKNLLAIIRSEFEEEINGLKFKPVSYLDSKGESRPMYNLTLSQAKQVLLRESKFVRRAVIAKLEEVERKIAELREEVARSREKIFQRAQMDRLKEIDNEDKNIYLLANRFVNDIVADCLGCATKQKNDMNEQELNARDEVLISWVDNYKRTGSKSKANMITRLLYDVRQVGKYSHLNKSLM